MRYVRMPIEIESPEELGYETFKYNLSESSYRDAVLGDLDLDISELVLCYADHRGLPALRQQLAAEGDGLEQDHVLVTVGAAAALFIIATTLLSAGEELVVVRPNYATNIETPRAIGADVRFVDLSFEDGFQLDPGRVAELVTPRTRYISVTHPHNPTGTALTLETLMGLLELCEANDCYLLVDETYRDMAFSGQTPLAATLSERVISVSSLSKTYGLPGIRIGWLVTRNQALMERFLAAKEQMYICGSVVDEEIALRYLQHKDRHLREITQDIQARFRIVRDWMASQAHLHWVEPQGGVVCFPCFAEPERYDLDAFYANLNGELSTYVGPGHWFEMPRHYFRIGYGWTTRSELEEGLANIERAAATARRN